MLIVIGPSSRPPTVLTRPLPDLDDFAAGTRLVWHVDPKKRTVRVFTDPGHSTLLGKRDTLGGGGAVLPGFALRLRELFAKLDRY
jgi:hypothetical protein